MALEQKAAILDLQTYWSSGQTPAGNEFFPPTARAAAGLKVWLQRRRFYNQHLLQAIKTEGDELSASIFVPANPPNNQDGCVWKNLFEIFTCWDLLGIRSSFRIFSPFFLWSLTVNLEQLKDKSGSEETKICTHETQRARIIQRKTKHDQMREKILEKHNRVLGWDKHMHRYKKKQCSDKTKCAKITQISQKSCPEEGKNISKDKSNMHT